MTIYHYLLISAEAIALALVPVILLQRKGPTSTFAWILTLIFLPVLGVMLFLLFGRTKIRDHRQLTMAAAGVDSALAADALQPSDFASLERSCYQVSQALTHLPATLGNAVTMLVDGDATYDAIGKAIDAAEHHVHVEYYLIKDDGVGRWFGERLAAAARRGVSVRLIRDGFGSLMLGTAWMKSLMTAGAQVRTFLPMRSFIIRPASLRNHRKIVVIDGKIGFTGGINICDEHSRAHFGQASWRDIHLQLRGPAVSQLQAVFHADWQYVTQDAAPSGSNGPSGPSQPAGGTARVAIIPNGPDTTAEAIHRVFFTAIAGAEREILITSPYFGPDDTILVALEVAALRGLQVKIVLPARSNHPVTLIAGRSLYDRLLEAGVHIYQYQPGMIHAKTLLIDRKLALIGSSNMDLRSFRLNFEVHALVHDEAVSRELLAVIEQYLAQSERIDLAHWRARGVGARVLEGACRLVSPLL